MKMTKKYIHSFCIIICCLLVSVVSNAQAQITNVKGKIIDKKDKEVIIGASVVLVDKDGRVVRGVSSDIDGNYSLPVTDKTYRIRVSYLGYKSTTPIAIEKAIINFQLETADNQMNEVTILGRV